MNQRTKVLGPGMHGALLAVAAVLLIAATPHAWVQPLGTKGVASFKKGKDGFRQIYISSELAQAMGDSIPEFVVMSDSAYTKSLRKAYPYGRRSSPFALIGHVNKDRFEDVVLDGREGKDRVVYACITEGSGFRFLPIERRPGGFESTGNDSCLFWQSEMLEQGTGRFGFGRPGTELAYYWRWSLGALRREKRGVPIDMSSK